jgi:hypothetical protein
MKPGSPLAIWAMMVLICIIIAAFIAFFLPVIVAAGAGIASIALMVVRPISSILKRKTEEE